MTTENIIQALFVIVLYYGIVISILLYRTNRQLKDMFKDYKDLRNYCDILKEDYKKAIAINRHYKFPKKFPKNPDTHITKEQEYENMMTILKNLKKEK